MGPQARWLAPGAHFWFRPQVNLCSFHFGKRPVPALPSSLPCILSQASVRGSLFSGGPRPPGSCDCRIAWHPGVSAAWPPAWMLRSCRAGASAAQSPLQAPGWASPAPLQGAGRARRQGKSQPFPILQLPTDLLCLRLFLSREPHLSMGQGTAWGLGERRVLPISGLRSGFESEDGRLELSFEPLHSPATMATAFASARPQFPNL